MTNISFAQTYLRADGIETYVTDTNMSALEGSIGLFPRRILVSARDADMARKLLIDLGLEPYNG